MFAASVSSEWSLLDWGELSAAESSPEVSGSESSEDHTTFDSVVPVGTSEGTSLRGFDRVDDLVFVLLATTGVSFGESSVAGDLVSLSALMNQSESSFYIGCGSQAPATGFV